MVVSLVEKFPLLKKDIKDLSEDAKEELLLRLNHESETMRNSFAKLVTRTQMQLRHSETTIGDLRTLFIEHEMEELANRVESTDTIPMVLNKVKRGNYWSFFNYEILESIITSCCKGTHLIAELDDYVSEFKAYCQRRVSEVPRGSLSGEHIDKQSIFKVKMDDSFHIQDTTLKRLKSIQYRLQKVLKMNPLQLVDVEDGCIELTFRYFNNAMAKLFPWGKEEKIALTEIGVQQLCYDKEVLLKINAALSSPPATTSSAPTYALQFSAAPTTDSTGA